MRPKPAHLGPGYAAQFQDRSVAAAYRFRPPYPDQVFQILAGLLAEPRVALDAGCGRGEVARRLLPFVERVDAVDASAAMIGEGMRLLGGYDARLRWRCAPTETAPLDGPYGLIVTASSLHWMEWDIVLPRFHDALAPGAFLAIFDDGSAPVPWARELARLIARHSTNREYRPFDLIRELTARGLFTLVGERATVGVPFAQTMDEYVESFHSRNGLSRERMRPEDAAAFDREVRALVLAHNPDGVVRLDPRSVVRWGRPLRR